MKRFQIPESMKVASIWVVWGFLAIGALGSALFVVLDFFAVKDQAAAWVQAIGSVLAICVAIWISELSHKRDRLREQHAQRMEEVRVTWLAVCSIHEAMQTIRQLNELGIVAMTSPEGRDNLKQSGVLLRAIVQKHLPYNLVGPVMSTQADINRISAMVARWQLSVPPSDWIQQLKSYEDRVSLRHYEVNETYKELAHAVGLLPSTNDDLR